MSLFRKYRHFLLAGLMLLTATVQAAGTILVFGDSLSAGYGIRQDAAWPALLARRLQEKRLDYSVVNASISGETTSGGRTRIEAALASIRHGWSLSPSAPTTACAGCRWRKCATT
jgi:acyl-CoA thioesterase-1